MDMSTFTQEPSTNHIDKSLHICRLVARMGTITMSRRKEVVKKNNYPFEQIALSVCALAFVYRRQ
jgi:hypothetical protein